MIDLSQPAPPDRPTQLPDYAPPPPTRAQLLFSADFLIIQPYRRAHEFAIVDPVDNGAPEGVVAALTWPTRAGFRIELGYRPGASAWEALFRYTLFRSTDEQTVGTPAGGVLYPVGTMPFGLGEVSTATARSRLSLDTYDIEYGRRYLIDESLTLRALGGSRIVTVNEDFRAAFDGRSADRAVLTRTSTYNAGGIMVGAEGHWTIGWGFSCYTRARGSLLFGDGNYTLTETNNGETTRRADVSERMNQTVPVMELGIGVGWYYRGWKATLGYEASHWIGVFDHPGFIADFTTGSFTRRQSSLSLEGVFFQIGAAF
jgi:hypothetical protein